jgi:hypothetical protein
MLSGKVGDVTMSRRIESADLLSTLATFSRPRELLRTLMSENPNATKRELLKLFMHTVKDDPEVMDEVVKEVARRLLAH